MKKLIGILAFVCCGAAMAQSSTTTGVTGNGSAIAGTASQTLGNRTVTINVANSGINSIKAPKTNNPPGTSVGTFSAGLSIGATLGDGFGSAGGTAGTLAGFK